MPNNTAADIDRVGRYVEKHDAEMLLDRLEGQVKRMLADGTFRGFRPLVRATIQEYGEEPRAIWRSIGYGSGSKGHHPG